MQIEQKLNKNTNTLIRGDIDSSIGEVRECFAVMDIEMKLEYPTDSANVSTKIHH